VSDRELAARRLLAVTEEELHRVVLDIHDGPVQNLFAALGQLTLVRVRLSEIPAATECLPPLASAVHMLEASLSEIREVITVVDAPAFAERTIAELLEELTVQHETLTGASVTVECPAALPPTSPLIKIAIYRILQEALSNIRRHAGVSAAVVRLSESGGIMRFEVEDHGRGFEPPPLVGPHATEEQRHIGLRGMRERAAMVNGEIAVVSRPGTGTRVTMQIPLNG
jgi:signal transduction histidine kinase